MRSNLFWLSDEQWQQFEPLLPTDVRGKERQDDRRLNVIDGIHWLGVLVIQGAIIGLMGV